MLLFKHNYSTPTDVLLNMPMYCWTQIIIGLNDIDSQVHYNDMPVQASIRIFIKTIHGDAQYWIRNKQLLP